MSLVSALHLVAWARSAKYSTVAKRRWECAWSISVQGIPMVNFLDELLIYRLCVLYSRSTGLTNQLTRLCNTVVWETPNNTLDRCNSVRLIMGLLLFVCRVRLFAFLWISIPSESPRSNDMHIPVVWNTRITLYLSCVWICAEVVHFALSCY